MEQQQGSRVGFTLFGPGEAFVLRAKPWQKDFDEDLGVPESLWMEQAYIGVLESAGAAPEEMLATLGRLAQVLGANPPSPGKADQTSSRRQGGAFSSCLVVLPRKGTTSAWSSKTRDIARVAGVEGLCALERARVFRAEHPPQDMGRSSHPLESSRMFASRAHDPMLECCLHQLPDPLDWFAPKASSPARTIDLMAQGQKALLEANASLGLALNDAEVAYLSRIFLAQGRNPSETEVMMFAQANSEHCRHKIFHATWILDGKQQAYSLFDMIRYTTKAHPEGVEVAYSDNAAVLKRGSVRWVESMGASAADRGPHRAEASSGESLDDKGSRGCIAQPRYMVREGVMHSVFKVETHNHPTGVAPHPGASTGAGGEIRDEGATGRGAIPRFAMTGFSVSQLHIPDFAQAWEDGTGRSDRMASALQIMLEGPVGAASFNNEFGRPNLLGYFRSFEQSDASGRRGYRKPLMIAGGVGSIHADQVRKGELRAGDLLVQLGGPGFRIGVGGGSASSLGLGKNHAKLDFDSVQRANPEMQRRAQQVIEQCAALGPDNPIVALHDVGAGGLSNAFPELVLGAGRGAHLRLEAIPVEDSTMSAAEIWCNESQERYALGVRSADLGRLEAICARERCPCAVIGSIESDGRLRLVDSQGQAVVDMSLEQLLGQTPRLERIGVRRQRELHPFDSTLVALDEACRRVLRHPTVASKRYLVTIADRSVGGLSHRDPMVGPWQVPVADHAIGLADYSGWSGDVLAVGERAPIALVDAAASVRMAIGEAICNLLGSGLREVSQVKLSANWMAASGRPDDDFDLFDGVRAASALAVELGIAIPVGKDSLSMRAVLERGPGGEPDCEVRAPLTLIASACAPLEDVRCAVTPQLIAQPGDALPPALILVDLGRGKQRMGGSILGQCFAMPNCEVPDLDDPSLLRALVQACGELLGQGLMLACHDRSDGGLWATVCEMCFAGHCGLSLNLDLLTIDPQLADWGDFKIRPEQVAVQRHEKTLQALFCEELGLVMQVRAADRDRVLATLRSYGLSQHSHVIGRLNSSDRIQIYRDAKLLFDEERAVLQAIWSEVSWRMAALRDDPDCAREEYEAPLRPHAHLDVAAVPAAPPPALWSEDRRAQHPQAEGKTAALLQGRKKPRVVILREQGVNSHREMAAAFLRVGCEALDVTMSDLLEGRFDLLDPREPIAGLAVCGGFSFGDVLGAGRAWAQSILLQARLREQFTRFFAREDCFALGVCNGCQMMAQLKSIIPGASHWPQFLPNRSQQFEGRLSLVRIESSASPWLEGLQGQLLPIVVSHGEGRASFATGDDRRQAEVAMRYALADASVASHYPENPNGSAEGVAALTAAQGRVLIMMPHPERSFLARQLSWAPKSWSDTTPWIELFANAAAFARTAREALD